MLWKAVAVALVAAGGWGLPAAAQGRAGEPAELPPAGFAGLQYVDSRGCAYVRAGLGGQVTWVRRVGGDRRPICGLTPTRVAMAQAQAALAADAAPTPTAATAPTPTAATAPAPATTTARPRPAAPAPAAQRLAAAGPPPAPAAPPRPERPVIRASGPVNILGPSGACPAETPNLQRFELVNGGVIDLCLAPGVVIRGATPVATVATVATVAAAPASPARPAASAPARMAPASDPRVPAVVVPAGYRLAWKDDRLNPERGRGTSEGARQMDTIWTRTVPQTLHVDTQRGRRLAAAPTAPAARVSTKAAPAALQTAAGARVQVGAFAVASNARAAEARLAALGLPVQTVRGQLGGRAVEIVRAGPFATEAEARAALGAIRGAGFGDAILRR